MLNTEEIANRFGYHKPVVDGERNTAALHRDLRLEFKEFAKYLEDLLPDGRAKAVAFTELENTSMWAHKAIAELDPVSSE